MHAHSMASLVILWHADAGFCSICFNWCLGRKRFLSLINALETATRVPICILCSALFFSFVFITREGAVDVRYVVRICKCLRICVCNWSSGTHSATRDIFVWDSVIHIHHGQHFDYILLSPSQCNSKKAFPQLKTAVFLFLAGSALLQFWNLKVIWKIYKSINNPPCCPH